MWWVRDWHFVVLVIVLSNISPAWAVVGGEPAAPPEPDAAVVFTQKYGRSCRLEGVKDDHNGYYTFAGIRYADPPLGTRRFQRPIRRYLAGEITANKHCLPCPQPDPRRNGHFLGHEDCLCLNVYAPKMPGEEKGSPVVFYIHGGNYRSGSSTSYGGKYLTQQDTILVTVQYRLGSLGFLSTGQRDASGNSGLFDLRAAMTWVTDYIEFFGGDPTRLVVMGQGSGGSAASLLALSSEGRTATGVAALSGTPLSPGSVRPDPAKHAQELAKKTNCPPAPAERLLRCLKQLPVEMIIKADMDLLMDLVDTKRFLDEISGQSGAGARVEGKYDNRSLPPLVADKPSESLSNKQQRCPLLTGVNSAETRRAVFGKYSSFLISKLQEIDDFIKNDIIGGLKGVVNSVEGLIPMNSTSVFTQMLEGYYASLLGNSVNKVTDGLTQIAEATGDALFNFPAYQSVKSWRSGAPAYLYSFEHVGNLTKGSHFLPGVTLAELSNNTTENSQELNGPSHGDELAYIFEPLDDDGNSINDTVSSTDARVRNNFVGIIARFAHDLVPIDKKDDSKLKELLSFAKNNDQFIKINEDVTLDKNFRFCQVGLWGGMTDRLNDILCKNLLGFIHKPLKPISNHLGTVSDGLKNMLPQPKNSSFIYFPSEKTTKKPENKLFNFNIG